MQDERIPREKIRDATRITVVALLDQQNLALTKCTLTSFSSSCSGMMGSQAGLGGDDRGGPQLPGLENLGADAVVAGGYITDPNIPDGMEFIPSSVPDGEVGFTVASTSAGGTQEIAVKSPCMTFEDYYAAFSTESHPSLSVAPSTGRLDRRNGERKY